MRCWHERPENARDWPDLHELLRTGVIEVKIRSYADGLETFTLEPTDAWSMEHHEAEWDIAVGMWLTLAEDLLANHGPGGNWWVIAFGESCEGCLYDVFPYLHAAGYFMYPSEVKLGPGYTTTMVAANATWNFLEAAAEAIVTKTLWMCLVDCERAPESLEDVQRMFDLTPRDTYPRVVPPSLVRSCVVSWSGGETIGGVMNSRLEWLLKYKSKDS